MKRINFRCTRVADNPDAGKNKELDATIEACQVCKENVWVSKQTRTVRKLVDERDCAIYCRQCVVSAAAEELMVNKKTSILHSNHDASEITEISIAQPSD